MSAPPATVLIVDDDRETRRGIAGALRRATYGVCVAVDGDDALRIIAAREVGVVITDVRMPHLDGLSLVAALRRSPFYDSVAIILMSGYDDHAAKIRGLELGADAFVPKPLDLPELVALVRGHVRRRETERRLRRESTTDELTGLLNRRGIVGAISRETARRGTIGTCVLMIDVDEFKVINDQYGHAAGDVALVSIARALRRDVRACDSVGRLGGDEFVVIMPDAAETEATALAERFRAPREFCWGAARRSIGLSVGITVARPGDSIAATLRRADLRMYRDKKRRARSLAVPGASSPRR